MKPFNIFIKEASLKGNPATSPDYLAGVDSKSKQDIRSIEDRLGPKLQRFMQLVSEVHSMQTPEVKTKLEVLAKSIILQEYGSILGETELNIKFPEEGEIPKMMSEVPSKPEPTEFKELEDPETVSAIQMRKLTNAITQGEAKNAKRLILMPETLEGMTEILGEEKARRMIELLSDITDAASVFDWMIPMEAQLKMWEKDKSGFAGSVQVDWENEPETPDEIADRILKSLEENDLDTPEIEDAISNMRPTITALGTDFAMLIHETIKGIYELISSAAIPQDEEKARTVIANTDTLSDELEDLRYGPYLAADLRDTINRLSGTIDIPNLREHVFGKLMQLESSEFLEIMKGIFDKTGGSDARVSELITEVAQDLRDWERGRFDMEVPAEYLQSEEPEEEDLSRLSKKDLDDLLNAAIDSGNWSEVAKISKFLE
jgi:hypothetical protein